MSQPPHTTANRQPICTDDQRETIRICYLVTSAMSTCFLRGQLRYLSERGYRVLLITSPGEVLDEIKAREGVEVLSVPMEREIHPIQDLISLVRLYIIFRRIRPHIVNSGTPKAGLLGILAAWIARVPVRIYTLHGLRLETTRGLKRHILTVAERIASACAHRVICVSPSLADEFLKLGLGDRKQVLVPGSGSANGIDAANFSRCYPASVQTCRVREQFGISADVPVIGYVGRLSRDKGTEDLVKAFIKVNAHFPQSQLLLLGDVDPGDAPCESTLVQIRTHPRIISTGFVQDVAPYYQVMRVFAFPSYREGLGVAALEAQAAGLPVVGYRATGVVDAVLNGITGRLVTVGAVDELAAALLEYLEDHKLIAEHGSKGHLRVWSEFSNKRVWNALFTEYAGLLKSAGITAKPSTFASESMKDAA